MRRTLIGLVAVSLLVAAGCGEDDDATSDGQGSGLFGQDDGSGDAGGSGDGPAYPQNVQDRIMESCTAQSGATEERCRCRLDVLMTSLPYDEFAAYAQALEEDPSTQPPQAVLEATTACAS